MSHIEEIEAFFSEARSQIERIFLSPAMLAPTLAHLQRTLALYANLADKPVPMEGER
jgi:hypothetical protein